MKFINRAAIVASVFFLSAPGLLAQGKLSAKDAARFVTAAKKTAASDLKDPDSAKFRSLAIFQAENGTNFLCGEINAKNSYGAYVGFKRFAAFTDSVKLIETDDNQALMDAMMGKWCTQKIMDVK